MLLHCSLQFQSNPIGFFLVFSLCVFVTPFSDEPDSHPKLFTYLITPLYVPILLRLLPHNSV